MSTEGISLCCCEYYDIQQERNHILACCCNCEDFDESFESLISGREFPLHRRTRLMATIQDRIRIPWRGGARQISLDAILPVFILPTLLLLATISLWWTIFSFTTMIVFLSYVYVCFMHSLPRTKFFFVWSILSLVFLYIVFEAVVIPFLEILIEENLALTVLIVGFLISVHRIKIKALQLRKLHQTEIEKGNIIGFELPRAHSCPICQVTVPERDHHCVWIDCCIGQHNRCLFILALLFAICALLYSSNLTLTSVCHPFKFYQTILLPDDCSEVYQQFELSLSFVSAIYSLVIAAILFILLLHQILLVSLGVTGQEWRALPPSSKCCLGITASRPYSRGFLSNWNHIMCCTTNQYFIVNH